MNKMVILVGNVGSGKSTYAHLMNIRLDDFYEIINQDTLGSRDACLNKCEEYLKLGKNVVIDRTNINKQQRAYWINLAKKYNYQVEVVEFIIHPNLAFERVKNRKNHPTINNCSDEKIKSIIRKFQRSYEEVRLSEGITKHSIIHVYDPSKTHKSYGGGYWSRLKSFLTQKICESKIMGYFRLR